MPVSYGFYAPHKYFVSHSKSMEEAARDPNLRCVICGMTKEEINKYGVLLCPAGRVLRTQRATFQFAINRDTVMQIPTKEVVVFEEQ